MTRDQLFLATLDDLDTRLASRDPYEVLGIALLLRKLLLDGGASLVDQVNRQFRIGLAFEIMDDGPMPPHLPQPAFWSTIDGLDPEIYPENSSYNGFL